MVAKSFVAFYNAVKCIREKKKTKNTVEHTARKSFYLLACGFLGVMLFFLIALSLDLILAAWYVNGYLTAFSAADINQLNIFSLLFAPVFGAWYGVWLGLHWYEWVYGSELGRRKVFIKVLAEVVAYPGELGQSNFRLKRAKPRPGSKAVMNLPWRAEDLLEQSGLVGRPPQVAVHVKVSKQRGRPRGSALARSKALRGVKASVN